MDHVPVPVPVPASGGDTPVDVDQYRVQIPLKTGGSEEVNGGDTTPQKRTQPDLTGSLEAKRRKVMQVSVEIGGRSVSFCVIFHVLDALMYTWVTNDCVISTTDTVLV